MEESQFRMSNLTCPKCGGSDSFISQRNIVKGRGMYQSGKIRGVPVCRVCDEIMTGSSVAMSSEQAMKKVKIQLSLLALFPIVVVIWIFLIN